MCYTGQEGPERPVLGQRKPLNQGAFTWSQHLRILPDLEAKPRASRLGYKSEDFHQSKIQSIVG